MRGTRNATSPQFQVRRIIPAYAGNTQCANLDTTDPRDHPRVCGEHLADSVGMSEQAGSSPRMRGTPDLCRALAVGEGIIPAYAGNTRYGTPCTALRRDHPRVCGEHQVWCCRDWSCPGSSPRMRGTLERIVNGAHGAGIIPAYAGNTSTTGVFTAYRRDHPRVCGEHEGLKAFTSALGGSSPRMRGTRSACPFGITNCGIIPAYAGNTLLPRRFYPLTRDHPRVCGEHKMKPTTLSGSMGSSPRMRGTHHRSPVACAGGGIIPAYAGNTSCCRATQSVCGDHPRVCGEHASVPALSHLVLGSSPRMRGTRTICKTVQDTSGIIPAYAGNTRHTRPPVARRGDHPRVCGEHVSVTPNAVRFLGSSPRMRGTPSARPILRGEEGIIPAYAGNTCLAVL